MIIDCHCHAGTGDGLTGPWDTAAPLDRYLDRAGRAGIDRTVLFAAFHSDYRAANRQVARIVASRPDRFYGFAFVHPERDCGRIAELVAEAVVRHGFCGLKVHRRDARLTREVCEAARAWSIPVLYDPMGEVAPLECVLTEYPDVAFIIPHLGSFDDDWTAQRSVLDLLARHGNALADTSGVRRFDLLVEAVRRAGAHKILFGSDGPWLHPAVELAKIDQLPLSDDDRALVTGGNFLRLHDRAVSRAGGLRGAAAAPGR
jgi:predicted TIM-barrel fold metal-dependent hydrolase